MSGSINKVILIGNLGKAPEIRATQDGREIANLTIATSESWTDKQSGEKKERTEWHRVVIYTPALASLAKKYLHKGSKIYVEGQLKTRKWTDNAGVEKYTTEVILQGYHGTLIMLGGTKNDNQGSSQESDATEPEYIDGLEDLDDEIPF